MWWWMLTRFIVVIILQYTQIPNYVVHLKVTWCCTLIILQLKKRRTAVIGFSAHPHNPGQFHLEIPNLIIKTLFPNKVTLPDSGWVPLLEAIIEPTTHGKTSKERKTYIQYSTFSFSSFRTKFYRIEEFYSSCLC